VSTSSLANPADRGVIAALLMIFVALFSVMAGAQPAEEKEAAEAVPPTTTVTDELFVRASLEFAPTSSTIATKLPVELEWTPAHVGVVDLPLLSAQGARVLGDALKNVSGLNVQTGSGVFDYFVVRGFDSLSSGLILTDGAPEPEVTFYQLYNAERVEVLKGPSGFLYGPNPLAGAVNIVRKQPVPAQFGLLSASFGSFGTAEGKVDWNRASDDGALAFRFNGLYRETDGWRDGREGEVVAFNPTMTWRPNDETSLHFNIEALSSDYRPDAGLPLIGGVVTDQVSRDLSYAPPSDNSEQDLLRFQVDFEHAFSDRWTLRNKLYGRQLDWLSAGTLITGAVPARPGFDGLIFRTQIALDNDQRLWGDQLEVTLETVTGAVSHRLLAGVEVSVARDDYRLDILSLLTISLLNPVETPGPQVPLALPAAGDSETTVMAPYFIDQMRFNDHWQLLVGLRYDTIDFEDRLSGTKRDDGELSPMVGVVFSPVGNTAIYVNFGQSFAPPSVRVVGERKPEESRQVELGLRQRLFGGRLSASLAAYEIERQNIAIPDDNGFTQQAGDQRSRGVELEMQAQPAPGWSATFAYAYTDSELTRFAERLFVGFQASGFPTFQTFDRSGNRAAFAPEHLANLWLSKRFGKSLTLSLGGRYVGEQFIAEDNAAELDGYGLLNAAVAYDWHDWRWTLRLDNLTDTEYETRGFGSTSVIPGRPFAATVGAEFRF